MHRGFARGSAGGVTLRLDDEEFEVVGSLLGDLAELVAPAEPAADDDPLVAFVGIGASADPPDDPALARLLPDAYADDPEAAGDFRRFTERSLREAKAGAALTAQASLERVERSRVALDRQEAQAWLGALNDLRLVLGSRLGVTEDREDPGDLPQDDPRALPLYLYDWLTWLQDSLLVALGSA